MQIINNAFYIVLFTTLVGAIFTILALLFNRVFRIVLPLWFGTFGMLLYIFPIIAPRLFLVSPEVQIWIKEYQIASAIWICGIILLTLYNLLKIIFAHWAMDGYQICNDERINTICAQCTKMAGLKNIPTIYFGTLDDPACVIGVLRPAIILNEKIIIGLTETQLMAVLGHEVMHIKRRHMVLDKIYDCICVLNWFNPLVWVAKKEFDALCETDCDKSTLVTLNGKISDKEYALTMLCLLELSTMGGSISGNRLGVTGFLLSRRRIVLVMSRQSKLWRTISKIALIMVVVAIICFSIMVSRGYFYPYPAYNVGIEYSDMK